MNRQFLAPAKSPDSNGEALDIPLVDIGSKLIAAGIDPDA